MTALSQGTVQDKVAPRRGKARRRRVVYAPSSMHFLSFGLICGLATAEFAIAVATVFAIEALYHLIIYGSVAAIVEPWLTSVSFALAYMAIYAFRYGYTPASMRRGGISSVITAWSLAAVIVIIVAFLGKVSELYSRGSTIAIVVAGPVLVIMARHLLLALLGQISSIEPYLFRRVLLIGTDPEIESLGQLIDSHRDCRVVASFCMRGHEQGAAAEIIAAQDDEDVELAKSMVRLMRPSEIILALPLGDVTRIRHIVRRLGEAPASISLYLREVFNDPGVRLSRDALEDALVRVTREPLTMAESMAKRIFDITAAICGLILLAPLMLIIAIAVKLDSPGPVFFAQTRYGFNWMRFTILKFRTMSVAEDGRVVKQATRNDPRITRVGAFLRRWNLDELPQLFNVLVGQMSLVGPRPHAMAHDIAFFEQLAHYARRHNVKPGITGWAQVNGYRGEINGTEALRQRLMHDLHYVDNWSLWLDLKIIFMTIFSPRAYRNAR